MEYITTPYNVAYKCSCDVKSRVSNTIITVVRSRTYFGGIVIGSAGLARFDKRSGDVGLLKSRRNHRLRKTRKFPRKPRTGIIRLTLNLTNYGTLRTLLSTGAMINNRFVGDNDDQCVRTRGAEIIVFFYTCIKQAKVH